MRGKGNYWGVSRGSDRNLYYDKCVVCGNAGIEGQGRHHAKGICKKCYFRKYRVGDLTYAPSEGYAHSKEFFDTRDDRRMSAEKGNAKRDKVRILIRQGLPDDEIAKLTGVHPRTVIRAREEIFSARHRKKAV